MKLIFNIICSLALFSPILCFAQEKENETSIAAQLRSRTEYRNGALVPRKKGELPATFINNRARISMNYKRSETLWYKYIDKENPFNISVLAMNLEFETDNVENKQGRTTYMQTVGTNLNYSPDS